MLVPFHKPFTDENEINSVADSIKSGWLTMGAKTYEFEKKFAQYVGAKEAVAVNSCTAALHLALKCAGLKQGGEVIVPTFTHAASAEVAIYFGAKPVFADIERDTHLMDASKIESLITKNTKVIMPVHYGGQPADMDAIMEIAKKHNLYVIEDAAHSFPALYKNRFVGTIGHATCFSFYATKTIATGEGGMLTTENSEWATRTRLLRLHGVTRDAWERENDENFWEYDVVEAGYKYNTTDINSAMGIEQLKKADKLNGMRAKIALKYNEAFSSHDGLILYKIRNYNKTAWHLYPLKLNPDYLSIDRNKFVFEMKQRGISCSVHFIPIYRFSYYKALGYNAKDYPESEWVFTRTFSLPIYPAMTDKEIGYVIENVLELLQKYKK
ncbi:MAG: DegT/DnrJ/EryC1/StrS family aminotransferase [Spirochaetota bacterium]